MKLKLINNQDRSKLAEGRNYRLGFAFATKKGNIVEVVGHDITACKDFLNDMVFSQHTGNPYSIYGCHATDIGLFKNVPAAYLVMSILKKGAKAPKVYDNYLSDIKNLQSNAAHIEKLLHYFEEKFKVGGRTEITKIKKNYYLVTAPLFWSQYTYLISLYTLLIRMGMFWDGEGEVMDFLDKFDKDSDDIYLYKSVKNKILTMIGGLIPVQDFAKCKDPHNQGIVGFKFPQAKVEEVKKELPPVNLKVSKIDTKLNNIKSYEKFIDNSAEFDKVWELS